MLLWSTIFLGGGCTPGASLEFVLNQVLPHSFVSDSLRIHDCSLPGSSDLGILKAIILEWLAIPCCKRSSQPRDQAHVSKVCQHWQRTLYHWHNMESPSSLSLYIVFIEYLCEHYSIQRRFSISKNSNRNVEFKMKLGIQYIHLKTG